MTHAIYATRLMQGHTEPLASFLIAKLGQHTLILGKLWIQKHSDVLAMSYEKLPFWPGHCKHTEPLDETRT